MLWQESQRFLKARKKGVWEGPQKELVVLRGWTKITFGNRFLEDVPGYNRSLTIQAAVLADNEAKHRAGA